jgi:hypothetical protein
MSPATGRGTFTKSFPARLTSHDGASHRYRSGTSANTPRLGVPIRRRKCVLRLAAAAAGLAGAFDAAFVQSHWAFFAAVAQLGSGVLLLANRFAPLGLVVLAYRVLERN